ncbi:hypothetical protein, partial [Duncaniella muris]|uniref:hypothetical protein n=1 Tax=Duncaniella muris TaxID=2094150 RepID=UPI0023F2A0C2
ENKSSVGSVSGLAKTEQPQILPNHCINIGVLYYITFQVTTIAMKSCSLQSSPPLNMFLSNKFG